VKARKKKQGNFSNGLGGHAGIDKPVGKTDHSKKEARAEGGRGPKGECVSSSTNSINYICRDAIVGQAEHARSLGGATMRGRVCPLPRKKSHEGR